MDDRPLSLVPWQSARTLLTLNRALSVQQSTVAFSNMLCRQCQVLGATVGWLAGSGRSYRNVRNLSFSLLLTCRWVGADGKRFARKGDVAIWTDKAN
jgi:hypothetical protein